MMQLTQRFNLSHIYSKYHDFAQLYHLDDLHFVDRRTKTVIFKFSYLGGVSYLDFQQPVYS